MLNAEWLTKDIRYLNGTIPIMQFTPSCYIYTQLTIARFLAKSLNKIDLITITITISSTLTLNSPIKSSTFTNNQSPSIVPSFSLQVCPNLRHGNRPRTTQASPYI
ncbi:hypothetical protein QVD17_31941 [Tagetes erecta]|uniref:Uncharacterized protein n=1 Tax=Tagetes erecta TaxID=13708 RepID=A0AAD8K6K9_TARER|nr:hypothetical protein QVD17_31941 [Tagetes erecta]